MMRFTPKLQDYKDCVIEHLDDYVGDLITHARGQREVLKYPETEWGTFFANLYATAHFYFIEEYQQDGEYKPCPCCGRVVEDRDRFIVEEENGNEIDLMLCNRCACALIPWIMMVNKGYKEYYEKLKNNQ